MKLRSICQIAFSVALLSASPMVFSENDKNKKNDRDDDHHPAAVIGFQDLDGTADLQGVGPTYSAKGYTFTYTPAPGEPFPTSLHSVGPGWQFNDGTTALLANSASALTTLKRDDNQLFALIAIDLAELNGPDSPGATSVTFQGATATGNLVSRKFNLDGKLGFQRIFFPEEFRKLTSVQWLQGDLVTVNPHMFDNVVLSLEEVKRRKK